ncbi:MAG TPA: CpsB/CapC family capsule biosynthesis tyrosine phosphatase [Candidatus Acidoferrum sp.]|nr:CpsB/CapC family capsule biosynthesis tyrosine phosphatase [Candidatus Acidoferrum sp.]
MIDIHCHFLPGIDDGPDTMDEAVSLARMAWKDGITHSILTPHIHPGRWENEKNSIRRHYENFRKALVDNAVPLAISFAAEVRLTDIIFQQLESQQLPFLGNDGEYELMLLEFPHGHIIPGSGQFTKWLLKRGVRPVIAHPERNKSVMRDMAVLDQFLEVGCLLQVTAGSLTGKFGAKAEEVALQLLDADRITFVATDAHNLDARPPVLSEAYKLVVERKGAEHARKLFEGNQRAMTIAAASVGSG